jgi:lysozyme
MINYGRLRDQLIQHEGFRRTPYIDSVGKLTIGVGRNLDDKGLSKAEIYQLLDNDIKIAEKDARALVSNFHILGDVRQRVLIDMAFNLGRARLAGFKKFLAAMELGDMVAARAEMLNSKWAVQVGSRAKRLAKMMLTGQDHV